MLCSRFASPRHANYDSQRELAAQVNLHGGLSTLCRRVYMHLCATARGIIVKLIFVIENDHEIAPAFCSAAPREAEFTARARWSHVSNCTAHRATCAVACSCTYAQLCAA